MLQTICNDIGKIMLEGCANAGRMMLLFTDTLKRISKADGKETVRQMAKLGADSLPIVMMTILFTGMVFSVQTAKEFVRFGASSSVGGIIAIVACYKGLGAKQGAEGVGIATTGSVVLSIVLIFITNYFLSILLYV